MRGGATVPLADLREILEALAPHLTAVDGGIAAASTAGPVLRRLFALGEKKLVRVSDEREPVLEVRAG